MKSWLVIFVLCTGVYCYAQTVSRAEYFFDTDPGPGNGTSISFTAGDPVTFTGTINTLGLEPGRHWLFVRTKTSNGNWSLYESREFIIDGGIIEAEYFFDTDPGFGNGTPLSYSPITSTINTNISTAGLTDGPHYLFVRTRHDNDVWSLADPVYFVIQTRIVQGEYFIDTDPGFGNGTPLTISSPSDQVTITPTISTPPLADGDHYVFIRTKDILGKWSFFEPLMFTVDGALPIELVNFTATATRDGQVDLNWTTATETNNNLFTVEHSAPGMEFRTIFEIPGAGTTIQRTQYHELHEDPYAGINYYRLRQTDFDGTETYSNIVSVEVAKSTSMYPNPVVDQWHVEFGGDTHQQWKLIEVFDMQGRKSVEYQTQLHKVTFGRDGISPGMYVIKITSQNSKTEFLKITFK